jgi:glutaredoxin/glutathione-dependent peroxiredoxin
LPGYLKAYEDLRREGISQIVCVAVSDPAAADAWGKKIGADGSKVMMAADPIQAATRMLGMELADPSAPGPKSLRYAAILDNGVILKMVSSLILKD